MKDSLILKKKPRKFKNINKDSSVVKSQVEEKRDVNILVKNNHYDLLLGLIPFTILLILLAVYYLNIDTSQKIKQQELKPLDFSVKLSPYPFMDKFEVPEITAESAIIVDGESRTVLYTKNPDLRFSMASTTKIMSALVALDYFQENSILTILSPSIEGSNLGFVYGEKFYFKDLLYAMFLPSSNEAAYALAQNYPGGIEAFVRAMNDKAQELKLNNTHFMDPAGLDDDNNFTTVKDLSRLATIVVKNNTLAPITATKKKIISDITGRRQYQLENLNKLLGTDGVNGIKTGTTTGAGEVLVTSKVENNHTYIIIVMKSKQRFVDTKSLIALLSNNIHYILPEESGSTLQSLVLNK